jgi:hypothetical protein
MYICPVCEAVVDTPQRKVTGWVGRHADKCEKGHVLTQTGSNWAGFITGFLFCLAMFILGLIPSLVGIKNPSFIWFWAICFIVVAPTLILLTALWKGLKFRSRPDPVNRISRSAFWFSSGVACYFLLGLVASIQQGVKLP